MNKQTLQTLMNESRKAKNLRALTAYRTVLATVQEREVREGDLSNDQIIKVIESEKKKYLEAAEAFGDQPEAEGYRESANILNTLLPQELPEEDYDNFVSECLILSGAESPRDIGKVMGEAKNLEKAYGIRVDMGKVSGIVGKMLNK